MDCFASLVADRRFDLARSGGWNEKNMGNSEAQETKRRMSYGCESGPDGRSGCREMNERATVNGEWECVNG